MLRIPVTEDQRRNMARATMPLPGVGFNSSAWFDTAPNYAAPKRLGYNGAPVLSLKLGATAIFSRS
jgi:hypothetical protein